ncbi:MAG: hypothetical protein J6A25_02775 [Lachnospiraceae bacterium]|nr:hypothetical protein [Lachnospiraceae bacterium]
MARRFWWYCPKCNNKVYFDEVVHTLFDDDGEAWFEPKSGVPFYYLKCRNNECNARWNIQISPMYDN